MKHICFVFIALTICLTACKHDNEPPSEVNLPITTQFLPSGVLFSLSDTEFVEKIKPWISKVVIANSVDEIPKDPLGFSAI